MILPYLAIALLVLATLYSGWVSFREPAENSRTNFLFPRASSRAARIATGSVSLVILMALALWLGLGAKPSNIRTWRFLIPEGYTGWVRIEFEIPNTPALPGKNGEYTLTIPSDGKLRTSSTEQYGAATDKYFYISGQGRRSLPTSGHEALIWGKINGETRGPSGTKKYEEFFVGTEEQFKAQMK